MPVLQVNNLKKSFGSHEVLKGISFSLEKGETLAIIGSSGGGKSTLLRCLNFLETPDGGSIIVNGKTLLNADDNVSLSDREKRMNRLNFGLVFQSFNLFPQYTVLKNVTLASELLAKERKDYKARKNIILEHIETRCREIIDSVGLSEKIDFYPCQLSGGQQQRVAIARALALTPDVLCFDEPTSALDPELTGEVLKVIKELSNKNNTMVIVTHEIKFAHDVADKIMFIDEGKVLEFGTPEQVIDNPQSPRTKQFLERYYE